MKQVVYNKELQEVGSRLKTANKEFTNNRYLDPARKVDVNFGKLSPEEVDALLDVFDKQAESGGLKGKHYFRVARKVRDFVSLATGNIDDTTMVKKLELLPGALKGFFKDAPHKWVFKQQLSGAITPHFFYEAKYIKGHYRHGEYVPPVAELELRAYKRSKVVKSTVVWRSADCPASISRLLARKGLYRETEESVTSYQEQFSRYNVLQPAIGLQMQAIGTGEAVTGGNYWARTAVVNFVREGIPTKVVLDDSTEEDSDNSSGRSSEDRFINDSYWGDIPNRNGMVGMDEASVREETNDEPNQVQLPILPYLRVYDTTQDQWAIAHIDCLQDYPWDKSLGDKLVLKEADKNLIDLLVNQTGERVEDIIAGKMQGVIVLATGTPGIGKTLTAEVFSEMIEKPLYTVQCSQLGLDVKSIEGNLNKILGRAARWGAILLIDEADVYIRSRGEDIVQNAIVGVFLRLLEYYRGVIFMTSNRGEEIDDAIISRATAWIRYNRPHKDMLKELWTILGNQYKVKFTDKELDTLVEMEGLEHISGRTVRNLLKLARMLVGVEGKITTKVIEQVSEYQLLD